MNWLETLLNDNDKTMYAVSQATGIHRSTLSRIILKNLQKEDCKYGIVTKIEDYFNSLPPMQLVTECFVTSEETGKKRLSDFLVQLESERIQFTSYTNKLCRFAGTPSQFVNPSEVTSEHMVSIFCYYANMNIEDVKEYFVNMDDDAKAYSIPGAPITIVKFENEWYRIYVNDKGYLSWY